MELTVIRDEDGQIVGAVHGHIAKEPPARAASGDQAGPMAGSGQSFEHVVVPDGFAEVKDNPEASWRRLKEHLAR